MLAVINFIEAKKKAHSPSPFHLYIPICLVEDFYTLESNMFIFRTI